MATTKLRLFAAAALLIAGCGGGGELPVVGTVTLDGTPLAEGHIRFAPAGVAKSHADEAFVKEGRYSVHLRPGPYRVEVYSPRVTERGKGKTKEKPRPAGPGEDDPLIVETLPAKYNVASTLKVDVAAGKTTHDFPLTEK